MGKVTKDMVKIAYEVSKKRFEKKITLKKAKEILVESGMKGTTATDYIYNYANLIQGKTFTRTLSAYGTEYYIKKMYEEFGQDCLRNALNSLSQHLDYYEDLTKVTQVKRRKILDTYSKLLDKNQPTVFPDEVDESIDYVEGNTKRVLVNSYERNQAARQKCIDHYGNLCQVCEFDFGKVYGDIGKDFIHVHHVVDIATVGKEYSVDPIKDLVPVCPNCHSMLHKRKPAFTIDELKEMMK